MFLLMGLHSLLTFIRSIFLRFFFHRPLCSVQTYECHQNLESLKTERPFETKHPFVFRFKTEPSSFSTSSSIRPDESIGGGQTPGSVHGRPDCLRGQEALQVPELPCQTAHEIRPSADPGARAQSYPLQPHPQKGQPSAAVDGILRHL